MAENGEKTEEATPYRLEQARERGEVPFSRDFSSMMMILGLCLAFYFAGQSLFRGATNVFRKYFEFQNYNIDSARSFGQFILGVLNDIGWMVGPILAVCAVFAIAASVSQNGFLFTWEKLEPSFGRLNPIQGFQRIFSRDTVVEFIKACVKVLIVGTILYFVLKDEFLELLELGAETVPQIFLYFVGIIGKITFVILIFMLILGFADLLYQKWSYAQRMKMSLQEVKEEMKSRDGDPHIRARIRQIQRDRSRKRMMEKVKDADVVVTNPTHVAVALQYRKGLMRAPIVVAKGAGYIAVKIKELAATHQVPILERKQLARFLYRHVEVNDPIPESLYTAVAEVLAYVYRMKKKFKAMMAKASG